MPQRVLILDGNQRSALAATRTLGKRGIPVVVADECRDTLAGSSRYCDATFVYPSPYTDPDGFTAAIARAAVERNVGVILPMTDLTTLLVLKHRNAFAPASVPFASFEAFETLTDKERLLAVARELGVPTPATYVMEGDGHLATLNGTLQFPIVLKPHRSRLWCDGQWTAASVAYAHSTGEAEYIVRNHAYFRQCRFLAQEYIRGEGQGVFALYDRGKAVAFFAHRRLREKPPSGGASVLSESIPVHARLRDIARRILDHVKWHGVAMVEFKVASDGTPYLIEVNARFWGSLQLAIDAGVDFPYLLYRMAIGETLATAPRYRIGVRSRWLLGDLDHLYLTFKDRDRTAPRSRWRTVLQFLRFFERQTRYEVNRLDDWRPFLVELKQYGRAAFGTPGAPTTPVAPVAHQAGQVSDGTF
jgi:predicted ATP-grasp superfamily ATP-dependent carboligase